MEANYFTILYCFCHTSTWICHGCPRVPHPEPPSLYHPSGSSQCTSPKDPVLNLDWWFISYVILYMFPWHSPKSSHPHPLPQSPKNCSIHLCLFGGEKGYPIQYSGLENSMDSPWDHKEFNLVLCDNIRGVGSGVGQSSRWRGHVYTYGWFMLLYGRNKHNTGKQLSSN